MFFGGIRYRDSQIRFQILQSVLSDDSSAESASDHPTIPYLLWDASDTSSSSTLKLVHVSAVLLVSGAAPISLALFPSVAFAGQLEISAADWVAISGAFGPDMTLCSASQAVSAAAALGSFQTSQLVLCSLAVRSALGVTVVPLQNTALTFFYSSRCPNRSDAASSVLMPMRELRSNGQISADSAAPLSNDVSCSNAQRLSLAPSLLFGDSTRDGLAAHTLLHHATGWTSGTSRESEAVHDQSSDIGAAEAPTMGLESVSHSEDFGVDCAVDLLVDENHPSSFAFQLGDA